MLKKKLKESRVFDILEMFFAAGRIIGLQKRSFRVSSTFLARLTSMKKSVPLLASVLLFGLTGCHDKNKGSSQEVISQRFIHKYGYDLSPEEWQTTEYPGQVVTTLRNGVTITAAYEDGRLHGPTTYTFPYSQTRESVEYYDRGQLIKKVSFSIRGIPEKEELYFSATHFKKTEWYPSGSPRSVEEYVDGKLVEAEYFDKQNVTISRIEKGSGIKIIRDDEKIVAHESFEGGELVRKQAFYENGSPKIIMSFVNGEIHGEKKEFAPSGEPLCVEHYSFGRKDGLCSYFQNGARFLELSYKNGAKNGIERHYVDGDMLVEETHWLKNQKHGSSTVFFDGMSRTQWYYNNEPVSLEKYKELCEREREIAEMNERSKSAELFE